MDVDAPAEDVELLRSVSGIIDVLLDTARRLIPEGAKLEALCEAFAPVDSTIFLAETLESLDERRGDGEIDWVVRLEADSPPGSPDTRREDDVLDVTAGLREEPDQGLPGADDDLGDEEGSSVQKTKDIERTDYRGQEYRAFYRGFS